MQMLRLIIDSVFVKIGIIFQKEEIEMEQLFVDLEIEQLLVELNIESMLVKLMIDQMRVWENLNFKLFEKLNVEVVQKGVEVCSEFIVKIVREGKEMVVIEKKIGNVMVWQAVDVSLFELFGEFSDFFFVQFFVDIDCIFLKLMIDIEVCKFLIEAVVYKLVWNYMLGKVQIDMM